MAKPLDTKKIAETANRIESLRAEIAKEEANLARLCGVAPPDGAEPKPRKPRRSRTNVEVIGQFSEASRAEAVDRRDDPVDSDTKIVPQHDPDRTDPAHPIAAEVEDRAADIPPFLRRGGNMTEAEKVAAAEKAMQS